ncbi:MAG: hypothetical protein AAFP19_05915 [Bacteroidota bacterium]
MSPNIQKALDHFKSHYQKRLGEGIQEKRLPIAKAPQNLLLQHPLLKKNNGPRIFHHGKKTKDIIILTHGYTDSPFYLQALGLRFHQAGLNVIMPLLPAHGYKNLGSRMEDKTLDKQWRKTIDHAVETAALMGSRISIGGFSTGGALGLDKILRDRKKQINGGLFLFAAAIDIGDLNELASGSGFLQSIAKLMEGDLPGEGKDPYKYPVMSTAGGMEVGQIVRDNHDRLRKGKGHKKIKVPVFAAHSVHDKTAKLEGLTQLMSDHVEVGATLLLTQKIEHGCLPLAKDIKLQTGHQHKLTYPPIANPQFNWMAEGMLSFFEKVVKKLR